MTINTLINAHLQPLSSAVIIIIYTRCMHDMMPVNSAYYIHIDQYLSNYYCLSIDGNFGLYGCTMCHFITLAVLEKLQTGGTITS